MIVRCPTRIVNQEQDTEVCIQLRRLITTEQAHRFEFETRPLAARRVVCGDSSVSWAEQTVPTNSRLSNYARSSHILQLIGSALNRKDLIDLAKTTCWVSRYRKGEYIGPHRDCAGAIQLLVCLMGPNAESGGILVLKMKRGNRRFALKAGDGLLFRAVEIEHYTTELVPTKNCPDPVRIVFAARYFVKPTKIGQGL
jgi:predicted 2-oxoglutarate/Fe(II)-dependent dioxygenase YbiX